jgi:branched-chain amino acid transport system substrate-binding protein
MGRWLGVILSGLAAAGCSGRPTPPPIHVGHVATLSGPGKDAGERAARGIRLAVQEQTALAKKDNEAAIVVHHADARGNLEAFEAEAVRLVSISKAVALLGGASAAELARLDRAGVPIVAPCGIQPRGLSKLVFLTGLSPAFQGNILARHIAGVLKPAKVVILVDAGREDSSILAEAFVQTLSKFAGESKGEPARALTWRYGKDTPLDDVIKRVRDEKPAALLLAGSARDLIKVRKGIDGKISVLYGGDDGSATLLAEAGGMDGVCLVTAFVRDVDTPRAKDFVAEYGKAFSDEPDVHAALAYDGARLLFEAIHKCKHDLTGENITKELQQLKDYPGLTAPLTFASDRQLRRPAFLVRLEQQGLKTLKTYMPEE